MGLPGRVPARGDQATKAGLLDLLEQAVAAGWQFRAACRVLELGPVDRSHRTLAHRGSYLQRVWVSPSSVRRVLAAEGLRLRPLPRPGRSVRKPFPDWVEYTPNAIWIYGTTHFTRAGVAATVLEDLVSRKWLPRDRLRRGDRHPGPGGAHRGAAARGLLERVAARHDGLVDTSVDDPSRPVLLA
ncbi:MAG TPA: hypothetical protein VFA46_01285 [Actinomycetes bacterium]|nr:hypothetical protein [Actinomycetes bacterium]